jgi:hypothetical protein
MIQCRPIFILENIVECGSDFIDEGKNYGVLDGSGDCTTSVPEIHVNCLSVFGALVFLAEFSQESKTLDHA